MKIFNIVVSSKWNKRLLINLPLYPLLGSLVILGIIFSPIYSNLHTTKADKIEVQNCQSFHTQPEAQRFYDLFNKSDNPDLVKMAQKLDHDKDTVACEHLPLK